MPERSVPQMTSHLAAVSDPFMAAVAAELGLAWRNGPWDSRLAGVRDGTVDVAWVCGLLHAVLKHTDRWDMVPVAAPVMAAERYGNEAVYFGDVIVGAGSRIRSLDEAAGAVFAYNEEASLSGYRMVTDLLGSLDCFARCVSTGSHAASFRMVAAGDADVASIDSIALDMAGKLDMSRVRVVDSIGPYPAPPIVVSAHVDAAALRSRLLGLHETPRGRDLLDEWGVRRFAAVDQDTYSGLAPRRM